MVFEVNSASQGRPSDPTLTFMDRPVIVNAETNKKQVAIHFLDSNVAVTGNFKTFNMKTTDLNGFVVPLAVDEESSFQGHDLALAVRSSDSPNGFKSCEKAVAKRKFSHGVEIAIMASAFLIPFIFGFSGVALGVYVFVALFILLRVIQKRGKLLGSLTVDTDGFVDGEDNTRNPVHASAKFALVKLLKDGRGVLAITSQIRAKHESYVDGKFDSEDFWMWMNVFTSILEIESVMDADVVPLVTDDAHRVLSRIKSLHAKKAAEHDRVEDNLDSFHEGMINDGFYEDSEKTTDIAMNRLTAKYEM